MPSPYSLSSGLEPARSVPCSRKTRYCAEDSLRCHSSSLNATANSFAGACFLPPRRPNRLSAMTFPSPDTEGNTTGYRSGVAVPRRDFRAVSGGVESFAILTISGRYAILRPSIWGIGDAEAVFAGFARARGGSGGRRPVTARRGKAFQGERQLGDSLGAALARNGRGGGQADRWQHIAAGQARGRAAPPGGGEA